MDRETSYWGLALLVVVTLAVRIGVLAYDWEGFGRDTDDYGRLAATLVRTGTFGYPTQPTSLAASKRQSTDESTTAAARSTVVASSPAASPVAASPLALEAQAQSGRRGQEQARVRATAYRPPIYPGLLCLAYLGGELNKEVAAAIHVLLGLLTALSVYYVAWRLEFRAPWLPALAVACDPILLNQSRELMTETLVTFLTVWAWALYLKLLRPTLAELGRVVFGFRFWLRTSLLLGLALGLACLTRPTMLPWSLAAIAAVSLRSTTAGNRVSIMTAALLVLASLHVGWMIRNKQSDLRQPILTTTHGGYTLLLANNPVIYRHFKTNGPDRAWNEDEFHQLWNLRRQGDPRQLSFWKAGQLLTEKPSVTIEEWADDRLAQQVAIETIKSDPTTFATSCLYRAGWFWAVVPREAAAAGQPEWISWAIGSWYGAWFIMASVGLLRMWSVLKSRIWLVPLMLVLSLTAIHCIYWSNMRMRAPVMPVVYVLACWPLMTVRTLSRLPK